MNMAERALAIKQAQEAGKVGSYVQRKPAAAPREQTGGIAGGALQGFSQQGFTSQGFQAQGGGTQMPNGTRPVMRDDYGFKMNDRQYEAFEKHKSEMNRSIAEYKAEANKKISAASKQYEENRGKFDSSVKTASEQLAAQRAQLEAAQKQLGAAPTPKSMFDKFWSTEKKIPVHVWNGKTIEGTYWAPKSLVVEFDKQSTGKLPVMWTKDGYILGTSSGGKTIGKEMHEQALNMSSKDAVYKEFIKKPDAWGESYAKGLNQWKAAQAQLNSAQSKWNTANTQFQVAKSQQEGQLSAYKRSISEAEKARDHQVKLVQGKREAQVEALREQYNALSAQRKLAYANLSKGIQYTGGKDGTAAK